MKLRVSKRMSKKKEKIIITKDEASSHSLPPIGIIIDRKKSKLTYIKFSEPNSYISFFGMPGSTTTFKILGYMGSSEDPLLHDKLIEEYFNTPFKKMIIEGEKKQVSISGKLVQVNTYLIGDEFKTSWCSILVPSEKNKSYGLLILIGKYINSKNPPKYSELTEESEIKPLINSLIILE